MIIDGFHGGQVTRIGVALSALTAKPIEIVRIRENRPNPGLRAQHIKAIEAVKTLCDAEVEGLEIGSRRIKFFPGELKNRKVRVETGTAGSLSLIIQAFMLAASLKGGELHARGGTDVTFAPPIDYLKLVTFRTLEKFGFKGEIEVLKRGYYPKGGGEVKVRIKSSSFSFIEILEVKGEEFRGISHATNLPGVAIRMKRSAMKVLSPKIPLKIEVEERFEEPWKKGCAIVIGGFGRGGSCLGEKGKRAEIVGREAAEELISNLKYPLDPHMSDQILPFVVVFGGKVKILETGHVKALLKLFSEMKLEYKYSDGIFESKGIL